MQIKGPFWPVPLGRRDGRVSIASETLTQLPAPFANITQLKANFASKGLSVKDLAVLSGICVHFPPKFTYFFLVFHLVCNFNCPIPLSFQHKDM